MEPILISSNERLTIYPIKQNEIWRIYKQAEGSFWTAETVIRNSDDISTINTMPRRYKDYIDRVYIAMAYTASNTGEVLEMSNEAQIAESRFCFGLWVAMTNVHMEVYSMFLSGNRIDIPLIHDVKIQANTFAERLLVHILKEAIIFCAERSSIQWIKERIPVKCYLRANELISNDRAFHLRHLSVLYSLLMHKMDQSRVHELTKIIVDAECAFALNILPAVLIDASGVDIIDHVRYTADSTLILLRYDALYGVPDPSRKTAYHATVEHKEGNSPIMIREFTLDADF